MGITMAPKTTAGISLATSGSVPYISIDSNYNSISLESLNLNMEIEQLKQQVADLQAKLVFIEKEGQDGSTVLRQVRRILKTPEGESIINHAEALMRGNNKKLIEPGVTVTVWDELDKHTFISLFGQERLTEINESAYNRAMKLVE